MIPSIQNNQISFNNKIPTLSGKTKALDLFLKSQENLSYTRFIQGTLTSWLPRAVLSRSVADFSEFTFLSFFESALFYFAVPFFGEKLFRNGIFKRIQPKKLSQEITKNLSSSVDQIKKSNFDKNMKNRLITTKAGILTACLAIPLMEYSLSFAKNLFTLKVFKTSDFNNIANLDNKKPEDAQQQRKVENHSKKVLKNTAVLSGVSLAAGVLLSVFGHKSDVITKFSKLVLNPGDYISRGLHKVGINSKKTDKFLNEYVKLDFDNNNGKLALSKGQLALVCTTGLFGYSAAAKDRGKLDFYEVWTRVPLVVLYTIFGSALLDGGFKNILAKKGKYPDLIKKNASGEVESIPQRKDLLKIAQHLSEKNKTSLEKELSELIRQKSVITGVPYLFSIVAMGFILSGIARIWTQYRFNQMTKHEEQSTLSNTNNLLQLTPTFKQFLNATQRL